MYGPWKELTLEEWQNIKFCHECGYPIVKDKNNETYCPYCTMLEEQKYIAQFAIDAVRTEMENSIIEIKKQHSIEIRSLKDQLKAKEKYGWHKGTDILYQNGIYPVIQEDIISEMLVLDEYDVDSGWISGITPKRFYVLEP